MHNVPRFPWKSPTPEMSPTFNQAQLREYDAESKLDGNKDFIGDPLELNAQQKATIKTIIATNYCNGTKAGHDLDGKFKVTVFVSVHVC